MILQQSCHSPLGELTLTQVDDEIVSLDWGVGAQLGTSPLLKEAIAQLQAYFDGTLRCFDLPLTAPVTPYTQRVLNAMRDIPYGETRTYKELAEAIGSGARAIGGACGRNPIPIMIPCHRVLARTGMGGYSGDGGLDTKRALLTLEGALQQELLV